MWLQVLGKEKLMKDNNRGGGKSFIFMYHKWRKEEAWRPTAYLLKYLKVIFQKYKFSA